jgi:pSer/pThr/pTyr-binding forkhead associated (FHA) protein/DNA-binding CsgD family transcriptional regulator
MRSRPGDGADPEAEPFSEDEQTALTATAAGAAPRRPLGVLIVVGSCGLEREAVRVVPLPSELRIGRRRADLAAAPDLLLIDDPLVSRAHARIEREPGGRFLLTDLGSSNGTLLDGEPVAARAPLPDGGLLFLGEHAALFRRVSEEELAALASEQARPLGRWGTVSRRQAVRLARLRALAQARQPALLVGERGSGRETVARALQADRVEPFVTVDCSRSWPEIELGLAVAGAGATLFLRDLDRLPAPGQRRLAALLEGPGGARWVLGAVTRDTASGLEPSLRAALGKRLRFLPIASRREDIPSFAGCALAAAPVRRLEVEVFRAFLSEGWPGELAQLESLLVGAAALAASRGRVRIGCPELQPIARALLVPAAGAPAPEPFGRYARSHGLSRAEAEVLSFACEGLETKEIAARTGRSYKTVESYWSRIYLKTGLRSQRRVIVAALRAGGPAERVRALTRRTRPYFLAGGGAVGAGGAGGAGAGA